MAVLATRAYPRAVDLDRQGTLQHGNRDDEPIDFIAAGKNTRQPGQWAAAEVDFRSDGEKRRFLSSEPRAKDQLYSRDFFFIDGKRRIARSKDAHDSRSSQNRAAVTGIEPAEEVARKEGGFD